MTALDFSFLKNIIWMTQFAFSVVSPLVLCILGSVWLKERFQLGGWVVIVGIFLGLGGALGGLMNSLKSMRRSDGKKDEDPPVSFNDHK